jgi:hypothetical protein
LNSWTNVRSSSSLPSFHQQTKNREASKGAGLSRVWAETFSLQAVTVLTPATISHVSAHFTEYLGFVNKRDLASIQFKKLLDKKKGNV